MVPSIVKAIEFVRIDENSTEDALGSISLFGDEVLKRDFLDTWDIWDGECLLHCLVIFTVRDPKIICTSLVDLPYVAGGWTFRDDKRHALPNLDF